MKLKESKIEIETSENMKEYSYGIGDLGLILDILRNRLYSNPILAVCREISCNALDAHREVKKGDQPITITLPNYLDPNYRIKDNGPGISPKRVEEIYTKYGNSTKRDSNDQIGSFGIGAKVPLSVCDSFTIETVVDGIKYNYACYIDKSKTGKLSLLSKTKTTEPNGTEIIIPVESKDFQAFINGTEFTTRHWKVKPIIKGGKFTYQVITPSLEGDGWMISQIGSYSYNVKREIKAIVDGIEYPLDYQQVRSFADLSVIESTNGSLYLYFNTGDLSLSANREMVHLDDETKKKIKAKIKVASDCVFQKLQDKVDKCANLWEANLLYLEELANVYGAAMLNKVTYKGNKLHGTIQTTGTSIFYRRSNWNSKGFTVDAGTPSSGIYVERTAALYINDLGKTDFTAREVEPAFDLDKKINKVYVIKGTDKESPQDIIKKYKMEDFEFKKLSDLTKLVKATPPPPKPRFSIFKYDNLNVEKVFKFGRSSIDAMTDDKNIKIICKLQKNDYTRERTVINPFKAGLYLGPWEIEEILPILKGYSLYGVDKSITDDKIKEHFEKAIPLKDFLENNFVKSKTLDFVKLKAISNQVRQIAGEDNKFKKIDSLLKDSDSEYLKFRKFVQNLKEFDCQPNLVKLYEMIKSPIADKDLNNWVKNNPDWDYAARSAQLGTKYPLLSKIDRYYVSSTDIEALAEYINLIDERDKKCKKLVG